LHAFADHNLGQYWARFRFFFGFVVYDSLGFAVISDWWVVLQNELQLFAQNTCYPPTNWLNHLIELPHFHTPAFCFYFSFFIATIVACLGRVCVWNF